MGKGLEEASSTAAELSDSLLQAATPWEEAPANMLGGDEAATTVPRLATRRTRRACGQKRKVDDRPAEDTTMERANARVPDVLAASRALAAAASSHAVSEAITSVPATSAESGLWVRGFDCSKPPEHGQQG